MENVQKEISVICRELFGVDVIPEITRPEEQFGDFATNVALQLAGELKRNPKEIALAIAEKAKEAKLASDVDVAGPGFINIHLSDVVLAKMAFAQKVPQPYKGQEILVEFGDPNPFKEMHIGHLYSYVAGDAICRLLEASGANVKRLSYHGDVGLHVAKAIWGMQNQGYKPGGANKNIGLYYAAGAQAYASDESAKSEIDEINKKVYDKDASIKELYEEGKKASFANFDTTLADLGIVTDKRYLESDSADYGIDIVNKNTGKVFHKSNGAIVYDGEKVGLHTRVFITGKGLPTYETKDLGLTELKKNDFPKATRSIIITANEQAEYFKVMLSALRQIDEGLADKTQHLTHGFVNLSSGKMSSRTGDIYSAANLMDDVEQAMRKIRPEHAHENKIGAIKYAFIKHRLSSDITYDVDESISIEGNSGPYLQYAHARARSILAKSTQKPKTPGELENGERSLVRKLSEYTNVIGKAVDELMPHHVCTYLYELSHSFNNFYEHNRVVGDDREDIRVKIVESYADTLRDGLALLGISAPDKM